MLVLAENKGKLAFRVKFVGRRKRDTERQLKEDENLDSLKALQGYKYSEKKIFHDRMCCRWNKCMHLRIFKFLE